ncbi:TPA: DUF4222 domain-containing protein [Pluralibacter gergoviae]|nr:DUF4222 domain-containing protein [Pluralibacter gergoviae]
MKTKNTGVNAGGLAHSEILSGDIYSDNRGERVTVKLVAGDRITYVRDGYSGECVSSLMRFEKEFSPVKKQTFGDWCKANNTAEKIQNIRAMIAAKRAGK